LGRGRGESEKIVAYGGVGVEEWSPLTPPLILGTDGVDSPLERGVPTFNILFIISESGRGVSILFYNNRIGTGCVALSVQGRGTDRAELWVEGSGEKKGDR